MKKFIIGWMRFKQGTRPEVLAAAAPFMAATRSEKGCLFFEMTVSLIDPDAVLVVECFESPEAHDSHDATAHMATFRIVLGRLLVDSHFEFIFADRVEENGAMFTAPIS